MDLAERNKSLEEEVEGYQEMISALKLQLREKMIEKTEEGEINAQLERVKSKYKDLEKEYLTAEKEKVKLQGLVQELNEQILGLSFQLEQAQLRRKDSYENPGEVVISRDVVRTVKNGIKTRKLSRPPKDFHQVQKQVLKELKIVEETEISKVDKLNHCFEQFSKFLFAPFLSKREITFSTAIQEQLKNVEIFTFILLPILEYSRIQHQEPEKRSLLYLDHFLFGKEKQSFQKLIELALRR